METEENLPQNNTGNTREPVQGEKPADYVVGKNKPPVHSRFSKDRQPDPAKQSATKRKKKFTRDLLKEMLNMAYTFPEDSQVKAQLEKTFGAKALKKMSAMEIATVRQIHKAISQSDTQAFKELMVQAFGQPKQHIEATGLNGAPLPTPTTTVIIENPNKPTDE